jgi:hypothetical protein
LIHDMLRGAPLRSPRLIDLHQRLRAVYDSRYSVWLLLVLGVARAILFVIAYPPAHGADSGDFFLYAAQFEGLEAPTLFGLIYPLYPLLIYLSHYVLGSIYVLIVLQLGLSAVQGVVLYLGVRLYSPALAFLVALMVLGDPQTGILYNFTSTEPIYMFLLNLSFMVFLFQINRPLDRRVRAGDMLLGVLLASLLLARPVGRYLIVPYGVLFLFALLLRDRRAWMMATFRTGVLGVSYAGALGLFVLFNQIVFDRLELNGSGGLMMVTPLVRSGLLEADNGPASAEVVALREACPEGENRNRCLVRLTGDWAEVRRLYSQAYQEMLEQHLVDYLEVVEDKFHEFLRKPGLQYQGAVTPSDVQCADLDATVEAEVTFYLEQDALLVGASDSDRTAESLRPILYDIKGAMCPPWPDNDTVREVVDKVAVRYRSLSRPHPYLWYGALGLVVLVIPWARRYLVLVLIAGAILANHAAISAAAINVQPRYIAVVNPYKGILVLTLLYLAGSGVIRLVDVWLSRRAQLSVTVSGDSAP